MGQVPSVLLDQPESDFFSVKEKPILCRIQGLGGKNYHALTGSRSSAPVMFQQQGHWGEARGTASQMATSRGAEQPTGNGACKSVASTKTTWLIADQPESAQGRSEAQQAEASRCTDGGTCPVKAGEPSASRARPLNLPPYKRAPPKEHRNAQRLVLQYLVPCMNSYGLCIVDNFLGHKTGDKVLQEVQALHLSDKFRDGELASQKSGSTQAIRGDKIMWVEGSEQGCENIGYLLSRMDKLIMYADGKLGNYKIRGRHKVSNRSGNGLF
ncbi:uncharacterized protein LOC142014652 [Carettochelys insculpta]|uniref:uncharacterized protein LOC142014652 n=1 Tax=Carettochelys insculpta TaxID=44489 RepID=UPI003EBF2CE6